MKKKKIYYWSPFLTEIATSKAVINSAYSLQKYYSNYETVIVDAVGEFSKKKDEINKKKIKVIKLQKYDLVKFLPKHGKLKSRIAFLIIYITSFFGLKKILQKDKPDFLIIHLITLLPLTLFFIFNFKTKCVLRISGFPIMSPLRKFLWSFLLKKVDIITCPTKNTLQYMKNLKITDEKKLKLLYDPVISIREIVEKRSQNISSYKDDFIAVGRLTKQKNFEFLIKNFSEVLKINNSLRLSIFGEGEEKKKLTSLVTKYNLEQNVTCSEADPKKPSDIIDLTLDSENPEIADDVAGADLAKTLPMEEDEHDLEEEIQNDLKVSVRCIPEEPGEEGTCIFSGEKSPGRVVLAKSY